MIPNLTRGWSFVKLVKYLTEPKPEQEKPADNQKAVPEGVRHSNWTTINFCPGEADTPWQAARVMADTWRMADQLKREAGIASTGRKVKNGPVWHDSLSWTKGENVTWEHMVATAHSAMKAVGLDSELGYQTQIFEHPDTDHPHIHIVVNLVHPITGKQIDPFRDKAKSQKWAHEYDKARGHTFCHERAAKYNALAAGRPVARGPKSAAHNRPEWQAKKAANSNNNRARDEAAAIRRTYAAKAERIKSAISGAYLARKDAKEQNWNRYCQLREEIREKYTKQIDAVYKHKRNRDAWPLTPTGLRDWKQTREIKGLNRRLRREHNNFLARERTVAGRFTNAVAMTLSAPNELQKGRWSTLFGLSSDPARRIAFMNAYERAAKNSLSERHFQQRRSRAEPFRAKMQEELEQAAKDYQARADVIRKVEAKHKAEAKAIWQDLAKERTASWQEWRVKHGIKDRPSTARIAPQKGRAQSQPLVQAYSVTAPQWGGTPQIRYQFRLHGASRDKSNEVEENGLEVARERQWAEKAETFRSTGEQITTPQQADQGAALRTAEPEAPAISAKEARIQQGWKERGKNRAPRNRDRGGGRERE